MKTQLNILVLSILFISMQSCVDTIPIPLPEVDAKLRFESDINVSKGFSARITTSAGFEDVTAIGHPEDIDVKVVWGVNDVVIDMPYVESCQCYRNLSEKPVLNREYRLTAFMEDSDIYEEISSRMSVPVVTKTSELEAVREMQSDGSTTIESTLQLLGSNTSSNFYHIIPYRKITDLVEVNDDEVDEIYRGNEIEYLDYVVADNNNLHLEAHFDKPGFLVDFKGEDISNNPLNLLLNTETVIDYENEAFTKVFYEVRSVTESYYRYEKFQSRILQSQEDGGNPAISYTNIIRGLGYFGGYSSTMDSVLVQ